MESHYILRLGEERSIALETLDGNPAGNEAWARATEALLELQELEAQHHYGEMRNRAEEEARRNAYLWSRVGHKIRNLRTTKGWSQAQLATKAAMNCGYIEDLEEGKAYDPDLFGHSPELVTLERIRFCIAAPPHRGVATTS